MPGPVWSRYGHPGHSNGCKATSLSLLQEQWRCLSLLLALGTVLLSPGCSLSALFLPTEDGHLITPNSVSQQPSHVLPTLGPACQRARTLPAWAKGTVHPPEAVGALPMSCTAGRGPGALVAGDARGSRLSLGMPAGVGLRVADRLPGLVPHAGAGSNAKLCQR